MPTDGAAQAAHTCHARRCGKRVPPKMLFCLRHWRMVPKDLQREVWRVYVPGQERDHNLVTREYMAVQKRVVEYVAAKEGVPSKPLLGDAEPCAYDENEPCETCGVARKNHDDVYAEPGKEHDYEPGRLYKCLGCRDDIVWSSDSISEHPSYDHDFQPYKYESQAMSDAEPWMASAAERVS